jgi:hypothetical protein
VTCGLNQLDYSLLNEVKPAVAWVLDNPDQTVNEKIDVLLNFLRCHVFITNSLKRTKELALHSQKERADFVQLNSLMTG